MHPGPWFLKALASLRLALGLYSVLFLSLGHQRPPRAAHARLGQLLLLPKTSA